MTAGVLALEQEIIDLLTRRGVRHDAAVDDFSRLDFCIYSEQRGTFAFDAKEKAQPVKLANWPAVEIPEEHLFILDDRAARKTLQFAPNSGLVVRDNLRQRYFFFDVVRLFLMPRLRVNRPIALNRLELKGKWLVDLRNGVDCATLWEVFEQIAAYTDGQEHIFSGQKACYGDFVGETIPLAGETRRPEHWLHDRQTTRGYRTDEGK